MNQNPSILISLDTPVGLELAGGKGANLTRLLKAGYKVPPGFIITTEAYNAFVATNNLIAVINSALEELNAATGPDGIPTLTAFDDASNCIRDAFAHGRLPVDIARDVSDAYAQLGGGPVAVRSSATAEDLPDLSFAGQQDTFLNVTGESQLLEAVVHCWSSLWTARAIGYRSRNAIAHDSVTLAIVVQVMVVSEVSGVLFTANPLSGLLSQSVIDATFGLGEALVSGRVEPDQYLVDSRSGKITSVNIGEKKETARPTAGGGIEMVQQDNGAARQALPDDMIRALVETGQRIQAEYGSPQDIEWAFANDELFILQSRAITSLFPIPGICFDPITIWFAFNSFQGLSGPMTPMGRDNIIWVFANSARLFGRLRHPGRQNVLVESGERLWVKISDMIRSPLGVKVIHYALRYVEPGTGEVIDQLIRDSSIAAGKGRFKLRTLWQVICFAFPIMLRFIRTMIAPGWARAHIDDVIEKRVKSSEEVLRKGLESVNDPYEALVVIANFLRTDSVAGALPFILPRFVPILGPAMASLFILTRISGDGDLALEVTRGMPRNVTTEMDLALWQAALVIRNDSPSSEVFHAASAFELAQKYRDGNLPAVAQAVIADFLRNYGMRGVGEIDFGNLRWREDPSPVMHTLKSYLDIDLQYAPDVIFERGEQAAQVAVEKLASIARQQHGGRIKEHIVRAAARRLRLLMGARESPKFLAIRTMGFVREALLDVGYKLVTEGVIEHADDLVYLRINELEQLSRREVNNMRELITSRRSAYKREKRRRQEPRVLVSDGRAFYEGVGVLKSAGVQADGEITGSPVSAGVVEGMVHVVLDPRGVQLAPGEILVCPGTDPAWTPLFLAAGGLVTEVGGMMTHGSVVAREYGIPAVVGVHKATLNLTDGMRIRLDGTKGIITILD